MGGGGQKVPAAYNSNTINDNEVKFGDEVENHYLFKIMMTS